MVEDAIERVGDGSMPPDRYTLAHRGTDLSEDEMATLVAALAQMPDAGGEGRGGDHDGSDDDGGHGADDS